MSKDRTSRSSSLKCLRVGLILDGQLRDERVFYSPQTITIGQSPDSTFSLEDERLPEPFALLIAGEDGYRLQATPWMRVRLSLDADTQLNLTGMPDDERFTATPGGYSVALSEQSRGKIVAGALTLLFQFIDVPAAHVEAAASASVPPRSTAGEAASRVPVSLPPAPEEMSAARAAEYVRELEGVARATGAELERARSELKATERAAAEVEAALKKARRLFDEAREREAREAAERARREAEERAAREAAEREAAEKAAREAALKKAEEAREREAARQRAASQIPAHGSIAIATASDQALAHATSSPSRSIEATPLPAQSGGIFDNVDRVFLAVLLATCTVNFGTVFAISLRPAVEPVELTLEDIPERFAQVILPDKPKEEEIVAADEPADAQTSEKEEVKVAAKEAKAVSNGPARPVDAAARTAAIREGIQGKGLLKMLGALGGDGDGDGAIEDVLGGGSDATSDIASALMGASGVGVATADSLAKAAGQRLGGGSGEAAGIGDLGTSGGAGVQARQFAEKKTVNIRGRVIDEGPEIDSASCDRDAIARFVKARMKSIQNCYERQLKRNPSLKGKIVVRFTINESGKPIDVEIEEDTMANNSVTSCIRSTIRMWTFPIKDNECPVAYPFIFTPSSS